MTKRDGDDKLPPALGRLLALKARRPAPMVRGEPPYCSFCGRGRNEYRHIVGGPEVRICDDCLVAARAALDGSED
ncbi:MAG: ClpX C4-type zinc finger protein [Gammaproteobacteria bacterium]